MHIRIRGVLIVAAALAWSVFAVALGSAAAQTCAPSLCGDVDDSGSVSSSDALKVLITGIGGNAPLSCRCESTASPCPNVAGSYSGSVEGTSSGCTDPDENGDISLPFGPLEVTQVGCAASMRLVLQIGNTRDLVELTADLADDGSFSGLFEEYYVEPGGGEYVAGDADGQFAGASLSGSLVADTVIGETCHLELDFALTRQ